MRHHERGGVETAGRYKGMSQCATRLVEWSGITEASARRPAPDCGLRTRRRYTPTPHRLLLVALILAGGVDATVHVVKRSQNGPLHGLAVAAPPASPTSHLGDGGEAPPRRVAPERASRSRPTFPTPVLQPAPTGSRVTGTLLDVTAYCWTGSRTASGLWPEVGMAAGPWPFGTRLRVEGVGVVTVEDRYGHSTQLDIFVGSCAEARVFGRRSLRVEVQR